MQQSSSPCSHPPRPGLYQRLVLADASLASRLAAVLLAAGTRRLSDGEW